VPKKLLVYSSKFSHEFEESIAFGWRYDGEPKHDWSSLIANKNAELQRLTGIYQNVLKNAGVKLIEGHGKVRCCFGSISHGFLIEVLNREVFNFTLW
jgi:glutathione reductase (NADPH)